MTTAVRISARVFCLASLAGGLLATAASPARAQSLRPNIMFVFDTSGSMAENASGGSAGEGPNICTTAQNPNYATSRIYNLKQALRSALAQVGTDEANFGLMSFPASVDPTAYDKSCPTSHNGTVSVGHYSASTTQNVTTPNRVASSGYHTATSFGNGCLMTTNNDNQTTYGPWFDTGAAQVIRVGVTTAGPGVTPVAANYDPVDGNLPAIYKWIDNIELPTAAGAVTDPELHAFGYTPLGRSFFYARTYFDGVVKPHDPRASCRQNVVIMLTDGADTCDDLNAPNNTFSNADCSGGGSYEPFHPIAQACQLFRTSGIKTYIVTDSGLGAADLAIADRIAAAGGTTSAIRVTLANAALAQAAIVGIIASTVPPVEVCNGKDDNCNGQIDEGVSNMCVYSKTDPNTADNLLGTAAKHCAVEIKNCLDDNCNGMIDEGFPLNLCGQPGGCPIPAEVCDGIDNNCNGDVDEGFDVGGACDNGLTGTCRRIGIKECSADKMGVTCNLGDAPIMTEICNGIDDDCNGKIDDGMLPGVGVDCGIQGQGCTKGTTICMAGKIVCTATSNPKAEACNGMDDDCNGIIDDGVFPGVGDSCLCAGLTQAQVGVGMCRAGRLACKGAEGVKCDGCVLPQPEICDGMDNDCDGTGDNTAMCPSGFGCREGACALLCKPGEFPCPPGYDCNAGVCIPNRCKNIQCSIDQKCDLNTGTCVDLCFRVTCATDQVCSRGRCLDCSNSPDLACQPGQTCIGRKCVADLCFGNKCAPGVEYCSKGDCIKLTCSPGCSATERCVAGECKPSLACEPSCGGAQYCDTAVGTCKPSLCAGKTCPHCLPATGECTTDPCGNVQCPTCTMCSVTSNGQAFCESQGAGSVCETLKLQTGNTGGGCSCSVDESRSSASVFSVLAMFGLATLVRGRRRNRR